MVDIHFVPEDSFCIDVADQINIHEDYMLCFTSFYTLPDMGKHMTKSVGIAKSDVIKLF